MISPQHNQLTEVSIPSKLKSRINGLQNFYVLVIAHGHNGVIQNREEGNCEAMSIMPYILIETRN